MERAALEALIVRAGFEPARLSDEALARLADGLVRRLEAERLLAEPPDVTAADASGDEGAGASDGDALIALEQGDAVGIDALRTAGPEVHVPPAFAARCGGPGERLRTPSERR